MKIFTRLFLRLFLPSLLVSLMALSFSISTVNAFMDRIVAVVNKEVITFSELEEEVRDERIRLMARFSGEQLYRRVAQKEAQVLNAIIEERLQLQEAKAKGFTVTEEELDTALQRKPPQVELDDAAYAAYTEHLRKQILLDKIRSFEIRRIITISHAEIAQYYKEHQDEFMTAPVYRLRQILFVVDTDEERLHKQSQSRSVYQRLQAGESFQELALKYSGGPEATEGGELGAVPHDELLAPLANALKTMQAGELSGPIETRLGFHILALDEITPEVPKLFEEVENHIQAKLLKQRTDHVFQEWLAGLKKKAFIEIKYSPLSNF
ncbi:MAG: peptidylprolyl isomerase [Nitrospirales bacterium]|nr:peptidylprolyl isomerase [Nitrospira sp.]MDR4500930.1 peptidylprolyl isomerase [Nitrospirales bacterium]